MASKKDKLEKVYTYKIISTIFTSSSIIIAIVEGINIYPLAGLVYGLSPLIYIRMMIQGLFNPHTIFAWLLTISIFISIYFRTKARRFELQSLPKAKSKNKAKKTRTLYVAVSTISAILLAINIIATAVIITRYIGYEDSLSTWYAFERFLSVSLMQLVLLFISIIFGVEAKKIGVLLPKTKSKQSTKTTKSRSRKSQYQDPYL